MTGAVNAFVVVGCEFIICSFAKNVLLLQVASGMCCMNRKIRYGLCVLLSLLVSTLLQAQGGSTLYSFTHLPISARMNALGGSNVAINEGDASFALSNPALLSPETHETLQLNYAYYMQGVNFASAIYGHNYKDNYFAASIHYLDYGKMPYADAYGNLTGGTFSARDVMIDLIYTRQLGPMFTVGAALKPIYNNYEGYNAFALGADVGAHFQTKDSTLHIGLSLQNIGWQLKGFYSEEDGQHRERLPLNLQLGLSYRFKHAPFRLSMTIHNMQRWNLGYEMNGKDTYVVGSKKGITTEQWHIMQEQGAVMWYDMMFRHVIFALDIVPKNDRFYLTLSYNHRRRMELNLKDQRSLAGFALGAGVRIKQVRVGFAFSQYTKGQYVYQFTLNTDIKQFLK